MFIASCSTLPSRVNNQRFQDTVTRFATHPRVSKVYIHYPSYCERLKIPYPPVPSWMYSNSKIHVNTNAKDTGPSTKFHSLCELLPPDQPKLGIILFDDDRVYDLKWIENLMDAYEIHNGNACVGYQGTLAKIYPFMIDKFNIQKSISIKEPMSQHQRYMVIKTASLAIYCRKVLPTSNQVYLDLLEKYKDYRIRNNDDIGLGHLAYKALVPIFIIPIQKEQHEKWLIVNNDLDNPMDSLSRIPSHVAPQIRLVHRMIMQGDITPPYLELATIILTLFLILILIIISVLVGLMYSKKK